MTTPAGTLVVTPVAAAAAQGPVFHDVVSFPGDTGYPGGGTPAFGATALKAIAANVPGAQDRTILAVVPLSGGGYVPEYVPSTDKLKVRQSAGSAAPMSEVTGTPDLSATTFSVLIISS